MSGPLKGGLSTTSFPGASDLTQTNVVYVSKAGSNGNSGLRYNTPKLTIGAAITAAIALSPTNINPVEIQVEGSGRWEEDVELPPFTYLNAPSITFVGTITLNANTNTKVSRLYPSADSTSIIEVVADSTEIFISYDLMDARGEGGSFSDVIGVECGMLSDCFVTGKLTHNYGTYALINSEAVYQGDLTKVVQYNGSALTSFPGNTGVAEVKIGDIYNGPTALLTRLVVINPGGADNEISIIGGFLSCNDLVQWTGPSTNKLYISASHYDGNIDYTGGTITGTVTNQTPIT